MTTSTPIQNNQPRVLQASVTWPCVDQGTRHVTDSDGIVLVDFDEKESLSLVKILIVDDEPDYRLLLSQILNQNGYTELLLASSGEEALSHLEHLQTTPDSLDLIFLDILMPGIDGIETCRRIRQMALYQDTPLVMLSGKNDFEHTAAAFEAGATEYLTKPENPAEIALRARALLQFKQESKRLKAREQEFQALIERLQQLNQTLDQLSHTDELTGVANRRSFETRLTQVWHDGLRDQRPLSVILLDIDYFKSYNDSYGHLRGDLGLRQVAQALQAVLIPSSQHLARYGGEEFAILLPDTDTSGAVALAQQLQAAVCQQKLEHSGSKVSDYLTISLGLASLQPSAQLSPRLLMEAADQALYQAKRSRNRYEVSQQYQVEF